MGSNEMLDFTCECGRVYHSSLNNVGKHIKWANCGRLVEVNARSNAKSIRNTQANEAESTVRLPQRDSTDKIKGSRFSLFGVWVALASMALLIAVFLFFRKTGNPKTTVVTSNIAASESAIRHESASGTPLPVVPRQNSIRAQNGPEVPTRRQLLKDLSTGEGPVG